MIFLSALEMAKLSLTLVLPKAHLRLQVQKFPFVVILDNLRSAFNVGAIFRSAECMGASKIHLCGYTATPADDQTKKATMGSHEAIPWEHHGDIKQLLQGMREQQLPVIALETVQDQRTLHTFQFPAVGTGCALLVGNERHGLEPDVLGLCTHIVCIPCFGVKNSLNVGSAFSIAAYEVVRQWNCG